MASASRGSRRRLVEPMGMGMGGAAAAAPPQPGEEPTQARRRWREAMTLLPPPPRSAQGPGEAGRAAVEGLRSLECVREPEPAPAASASTAKSVRLAPRKHRPREEHFAASVGHTNWLQICLQKSETPTQSDINGFSALHMASLHGRLDCMKMLIERFSVDVDLTSLTGWRPIHLVMNKESEGRALQCLQYLIEKGADINAKNQNGVSPLHKAASEGRQDCIQALVDAGADVHAEDVEGQEPIDLCRMWGHKACAKYLASAMWKQDKANFALELSRLNKIKAECQIREQEFLKREQREMDFVNSLAYEQWLEKKGLAPPSTRILTFLKKRAQSVTLRKQTARLASRVPSPTSRAFGDLPEKVQQQPSWNISTNVWSAPATSILRPSAIRLGIDPDKPAEHDFTSFLVLFKDKFGKPEIYVNNWGKVSITPDLPFDVIQKSIYPCTQVPRLAGPQDFKPRHIFDVPSKRHPSPEHRWTDQMALSLRETLDPAYVGTLKAHLATYTDPTVVFPKLEPDCNSGKESSTQSPASSRLN